MSVIEYNIKTIICHILILVGMIWLLCDFLRTLRNPKFKVTGIVICVVIVSVIFVSLFLSVVYRGVESTGVITDIVTTGSWAGLMDTYKVDIKLISGQDIRVSTSLFSSKKLKDVLKNVNVGDKISFSYGGYFDVIYNLTIA